MVNRLRSNHEHGLTTCIEPKTNGVVHGHLF